MRACLLLICLTSPALASPWVLRPGDLVVVGQYDFERADEEFLDSRSAQGFPLEGRLSASTYSIDLRLGVFEGFELEMKVPIKQVTYTADPVILLDDGGATPAIDFYQENVIDLNRSAVGVADIRFAGRYQLFGGPFAGALAVGLKTPTGYAKPEGTFGDRPTSRQEFVDGVGRFVNPDNVTDDVTLGDGQLDVDVGLLLGWAMRSGTFTRIDALYRFRFGGAADQIVGGLRVGQLIAGRLLLFAGLDGEYAVSEGELIGISVAAIDPEVPAEEYLGTNNLDLRELRLERDQISVPLGVIYRLTDAVEVNLAWSQVIWGRNTAATQTVSAGVGVRTNLLR